MLTINPVLPSEEMVDDVKTYLRIEHDDENPLLSSLIAVAIDACEAFCGQLLVARAVIEERSILGRWEALGVLPVRSITQAIGVEPNGATSLIPVTRYALDISADGTGWFRVFDPGTALRVRVTYEAGLALLWSDLAPALRQGIIRLVGHLHANRDGGDDRGPPAAVAALWRPFRQMRLNVASAA